MRLIATFFLILIFFSSFCQSKDSSIHLVGNQPFRKSIAFVSIYGQSGRFINPIDGIRIQSNNKFDSVFSIIEGKITKVQKFEDGTHLFVVKQQKISVIYIGLLENLLIFENHRVQKGEPLFTMKSNDKANELTIVVYNKEKKLSSRETLNFLLKQ